MTSTGMSEASFALASMRRLASSGRFEQAIATGRAVSGLRPGSSVAAELATELAWLAFQTGAGLVGLADADRAIAQWRAQGDRANEARSRAIRALLELELGRGEAAAEQAIDALHIAETSGDKVAVSWALNIVGVVFWYCQQHARAAEYCGEALALARDLGEPLLVGLWLVNVAGVQQAMAASARDGGDALEGEIRFQQALAASREALVLLEREGELAQRIVCLLNLTMAHLARSEIAEAVAVLRTVDELPVVDGERVRLFRDEVAVEVLLASGRYDAALPLAERGLAAAEKADQFEAVLHAVRQLAEANERLGRPAEALAWFKRRHAMEQRIAAETTQQRARMAETILGLKRLKAEMADVTRQREAFASSLMALSREARDLAEDMRRDALTGISNRRHLDEVLADLSPDATFAFAMVDLDHFKSVNDDFSHALGDSVLRHVAQTLRRCSRADDFVARYGGEEFAIVMFDADLALGRRICRRLRLAVQALEWDCSSPPLKVTASFGLAASAEADEVAELVAIADRRLYAAKRAGRDRVVSRDRPGPSARSTDRASRAFVAERPARPGSRAAALMTPPYPPRPSRGELSTLVGLDTVETR